MSQHKLARAALSMLALPALAWAGYPDVPRSHWAADAVHKVGQVGVMTAKPDGRFHGEKVATRYELAAGLARVMAELENRMVATGGNPADIVPYIERINLYVADEIDHLKQEQKELRSTVQELLDRLGRQGIHASMPQIPSAPMIHPHKSVVPHTELRHAPEVRPDQRVHPLGAVDVPARVKSMQVRAKRMVLGGTTTATPVTVAEESATTPATAATPVAEPVTTSSTPDVESKIAATHGAPAVQVGPITIPATTPISSNTGANGKHIPSDAMAWGISGGVAVGEDEAEPVEDEGTEATPATGAKATKTGKTSKTTTRTTKLSKTAKTDKKPSLKVGPITAQKKTVTRTQTPKTTTIATADDGEPSEEDLAGGTYKPTAAPVVTTKVEASATTKAMEKLQQMRNAAAKK